MTEAKAVAHVARDGLVMFECPGCHHAHGVSVNPHRNVCTNATWGWNQSLTSPTFTPSILVNGVQPLTDDEHRRIMAGEHVEPRPYVCHSHVQDGMIAFLTDCTHELAGKTVPLPPWDET